MSGETAISENTEKQRFYKAHSHERDVVMTVIEPIMEVLWKIPPATRLNVVIGLCANVALCMRLKDGSTPMSLWKDDMEPGVAKTIEANMPEWLAMQKSKEAVAKTFSQAAQSQMPVQSANGVPGKPHKGKLTNWYRESGGGGAYWIRGTFVGHPELDGHHSHTSVVIGEHPQSDGTIEIETANSRYTLVGDPTQDLGVQPNIMGLG